MGKRIVNKKPASATAPALKKPAATTTPVLRKPASATAPVLKKPAAAAAPGLNMFKKPAAAAAAKTSVWNLGALNANEERAVLWKCNHCLKMYEFVHYPSAANETFYDEHDCLDAAWPTEEVDDDDNADMVAVFALRIRSEDDAWIHGTIEAARFLSWYPRANVIHMLKEEGLQYSSSEE